MRDFELHPEKLKEPEKEGEEPPLQRPERKRFKNQVPVRPINQVQPVPPPIKTVGIAMADKLQKPAQPPIKAVTEDGQT
jgi:hypothetical protein